MNEWMDVLMIWTETVNAILYGSALIAHKKSLFYCRMNQIVQILQQR